MEADSQWEQAASVYQAALARLGEGGGRQNRFWLLSSLGEISFERQEYAQARRWLDQAETVIDGLEPDAPEHVRLLNNWASLFLVEGNLTAAEKNLSRAVKLLESAGDPLDLAATLHNLASVEMQTGRLDDATAHAIRALAIWRQQLGDRHPYVMKAWISLSTLQGLSGDWRAAERSLKSALSIAETPEGLANYAAVLEKLGRRNEARSLNRRLPNRANFLPPHLVDAKAIPHEANRPGVRVQ